MKTQLTTLTSLWLEAMEKGQKQRESSSLDARPERCFLRLWAISYCSLSILPDSGQLTFIIEMFPGASNQGQLTDVCGSLPLVFMFIMSFQVISFILDKLLLGSLIIGALADITQLTVYSFQIWRVLAGFLVANSLLNLIFSMLAFYFSAVPYVSQKLFRKNGIPPHLCCSMSSCRTLCSKLSSASCPCCWIWLASVCWCPSVYGICGWSTSAGSVLRTQTASLGFPASHAQSKKDTIHS